LGNYGKQIRLNRILHQGGGGTIVVAFDHPLVHGPIPGTTDPGGQIRRFADAQVDAVLVNFGNIGSFAEVTATRKTPGLIARLDWTSALGSASGLPQDRFQSCVVAAPEDAVRAGADAVIVFLILGSGDAEFEKEEIARVGTVARECEQLGMPLIVESLARGPKVQNPCDPKWLKLHSRVAAELGADLIKTEFSGDAATMSEVVGACPIPILVLGGSRSGSDEEVLKSVRSIKQSGAGGIFFGRNVFQADDMGRLLQKVRAVLDERESE